jgi:hypothetical protein
MPPAPPVMIMVRPSRRNILKTLFSSGGSGLRMEDLDVPLPLVATPLPFEAVMILDDFCCFVWEGRNG